jgi:benzoyl-CoA reductase subunit B
MTTRTAYQTKPLECWRWAKELRARHFQDIITAKEQGKLLAVGIIDWGHPLMEGIEGLLYYTPEAWVSNIVIQPDLAARCAEAAEARGFGRDFCGYIRFYYGSMFANISPFGGDFPQPDLAVAQAFCSLSGKWYQPVADHLGIPIFAVERALSVPRRPVKEHLVDYMTSLYQDMIEWLEKVTGKRFNDERFIQATYNMCRSQVLWSEICQLNQAVPAPLDLKSMYSLWFPAIADPSNPETVAFYTAVKEEVQERVAQGIAAIPVERCRLFHDAQPPWYFLRFFRQAAAYGANFIGSVHIFTMGGAFEVDAQGRVTVKQDPLTQRIRFKNREEALRFLARWDLTHALYESWLIKNKIEITLAMVQDWHVDGLVFHHDRACQGLSLGQMEVRLALQERGLPTTGYEASFADKRDFAENQVIGRLETFLESLGLTRA